MRARLHVCRYLFVVVDLTRRECSLCKRRHITRHKSVTSWNAAPSFGENLARIGDWTEEISIMAAIREPTILSRATNQSACCCLLCRVHSRMELRATMIPQVDAGFVVIENYSPASVEFCRALSVCRICEVVESILAAEAGAADDGDYRG